MSPTKRIFLLYTFLFVLALCMSNAKPDSIALIDTGGQSDLISLTAETAGMTVGWEFSPTADIRVTELGYFDLTQDGLNTQHKVGIWDINQQLMVSGTVARGVAGSLAGEYRYVSVSSTLLLAGQTFIIGATVPVSMSEPGFAPDFYPNNTVQINPIDIAFDPHVSLIAANRYVQSNTIDMFELDFPDAYKQSKPLFEYESTFDYIDFGSGQQVGTLDYYFLAPNFRFVLEPDPALEYTPEPTALILLVVGATSVLVRSRGQHKNSQLSFRQRGEWLSSPDRRMPQ